MKYLLESQLSSYLRPDKTIEQFIGRIEFPEYSGFRWISIDRDKDEFKLIVHEVFDDSNEIESIYNFSYIEPDDLYGKEIQTFDSLDDALETAERLYSASRNRYLTFGFLDEELNNSK
ncbi:hypothetical protein NF867_14820 [Solitalea sp. MAHUQ-68]|uniref:Uncharacterized protein n=1 Tax=Solitalea agri TaxID=2953739 RepID=A0A9X2F3J7_9SPHI|nr:hypothetical protein [Solitalea agri]MCO4294134.1 hypothetical protein [Solitalea agri]